MFVDLDILDFSHYLDEQVQHVRLVLQRLLENRHEIYQSSIQFSGYIIEEGHIKADPNKVQAVADWPTRFSRQQL